MNTKQEIIKSLAGFTKTLAGEPVEIKLEIPQDSAHGDYSCNVALQLSKKLGKNPREIADDLKTKIQDLNLDILEKVEVAGPGFLNFYLSKEYFSKNLDSILDQKENYGKSDENKGQKVVVEYSSPNIAKPFTIGHLRSTIIGSALANILSATGWQVFRDNHLGDWGTQFGKQIYAIKEWGNESDIENAENPVKELVSLYVKFHEEAEKNPELEDRARAWFKKLEDGDPEARRLWQKCIDWSFKEFDKLYKALDVSFTENNGRGFGESYFEDKMTPIVAELEEKKLLKEDKGAKLVYFENDKYPPLMVLKQDGATLYSTRDLATDKHRLETHGDEVVIINEVGAEQSLYFNQLYELEKILGWVKEGQRIHVRHGLYRFKDMKMSTRRGNTIWLEDVLREAIDKAQKLGKEGETVSKEIGIGALKWNDLKRDPVADIVFDWDDMLSMDGNSGPYVQYTYARTQSILAKVEGISSELRIQDLELNKEELELLRKLQYFSEIVSFASSNLSTSVLCNYLYELAKEFNLFYEKHRILNIEDEDTKAFRIELTAAVGQVIKNGLTLLGISSPQKI
ncbi:MAG: arginine--tRNA ligase [Candidatus Levybacteria bacterium]|nr:arginine--tRNA ligase [Candidatus Levybacteria bacterium]